MRKHSIRKMVVSKLNNLFSEINEYWRIGTVAASIVLALLILGLLIRKPFIAEANVEIGGIIDLTAGLVTFQPFEGANEVEPFFSKFVFKLPIYSKNSCSVDVTYSVDGPRVKLICGARTEEQSRELILSAISRLEDRHKNFYEVANKFYGQRSTIIEVEIRERERIVGLLRSAQTSVLRQKEIIEQQIAIEKLRGHQALELQLGRRVRPTQIDAKNISIVDRRPSLKIWTIVLLMAISSGILVAVFFARLNRTEHE
jgi:hypothetical protein